MRSCSDNKGLMAGIALDGSKITRITPESERRE